MSRRGVVATRVLSIPQSIAGLAVVFLLFLPLNSAAQDTGFVVLSPIENGPATVAIDGRMVDTLSAEELTLEVRAGSRRLEVHRTGFSTFSRVVHVPAGDVVQITVNLRSSGVGIVEDDATSGAATRIMNQLRVIHLDPVRVAIAIDGQQIGHTPATLRVPIGELRIRIGSQQMCLLIPEGGELRLRMRSGRVEELEGLIECSANYVPVSLSGVPGGATVYVDGDQARRSRLRVTPNATHSISISHPEYLSIAFDVEPASRGDSVVVRVDLGPKKPALPDVTRPSPPAQPNLDLPPRPMPPDPPDPAGLDRLRSARSKYQAVGVAGGFETAAATTVWLGIWGYGLAVAGEDPAACGYGWGCLIGGPLAAWLIDKMIPVDVKGTRRSICRQYVGRTTDDCKGALDRRIAQAERHAERYPALRTAWKEDVADYEEQVAQLRSEHEDALARHRESMAAYERERAAWEDNREINEQRLNAWREHVRRERGEPVVRVIQRAR